MSSYLGVVMAGHVVPGVVDPNVRKSFITNSWHGPPAKVQSVQDLPKVPAPLGDDKNPQIMEHIKKMVMSEIAKPIAEAMPGYRAGR